MIQREEKLMLLANKYFDAVATYEEESELKNLVGSYQGSNPELIALKDYFNLISSNLPSDLNLDEMIEKATNDRQNMRSRFKITFDKWISAAAVLIMLIALSVYIVKINKSEQQPYIASKDSFEDPYLAYIETKRTLMMVSEKLNQNTRPLNQLEKLDQGIDPLDEFSKLGNYSNKVFKKTKK